MRRRLRWSAAVPALALSTAACVPPGGGGPDPQAVLEIAEPVSLSWTAGQAYVDSPWGLTITNTSTVDDTAPPLILVNVPPGIEVEATPSLNIPCDHALEAGEECAVLLEFSGTVQSTVVGTVSVSGGAGTQGDSEAVTINAV